MAKPDDYKHLTLTDNGWWFRLFRNRRIVAQASFAASRYGGFDKALAAARRHRDECLARFEPKPSRQAMLRTRANRNNTSGVSGVRWVERYRANGGASHYYKAFWSEPDEHGYVRQRSKCFTPCETTGLTNEEAFEAARRYRKKMERRHYRGRFGKRKRQHTPVVASRQRRGPR